MSKTLSNLFAEFPFPILNGTLDATLINGIRIDSREIQPGDLFVATVGGVLDGHEYIPQAVAGGAAVVVGSWASVQIEVPYIQVENSRQALAYLAAAFYDYPALNLTLIGVTGTDGKTTTCNILYEILKSAGIKAGMISTVNAVIGADVLDTGFHVTTPDAPDVQRYLAQMVSAGLTHVVLETTSHGWAQYRVDACEIDVGVVTNITHEHLDEHGSYENYRAAKGRLFESLSETKDKGLGVGGLGVLNADDESFDFLNSIVPEHFVSYGMQRQADIIAENVEFHQDSIHFDAVGLDFRVPVTSRLVGAFNVSNCLAAFTAAVLGLGIDPHVAAQGIASLVGIPGRMERIDLGQDFTAIVDFAHTPNALKNAIETGRKITTGKVIVTFGSAGLRDREKRRMMAEISAEWADLTVLTAEDPRTESLDHILAEMAAGVEARGGIEGETFWRVPDRGDAIRFCLSLANPGDLVLACGKGHEQSMCFETTEYPWDDRIALKAAISQILNAPGPEMPYLPTQN
jgi:UDP-N-acetylmuramoyl-L-alanyl-D-glutamate--2,6-diaminopimelate ligase